MKTIDEASELLYLQSNSNSAINEIQQDAIRSALLYAAKIIGERIGKAPYSEYRDEEARSVKEMLEMIVLCGEVSIP